MGRAIRFCLPLLALLNSSPGLAQSIQPASPECLKVLVHADRGWFVFFDGHSSELTPRANTILQELASVFLKDHGRAIVLNGNTDNAETSADDLGLGARRAETVAAALRDAGVSQTAIYIKDLGSSAPLAIHPAGVPDPQNRRVDLIPIGLWNEGHRSAVRDCKAWVRAICFRSLATDQLTLCEHALNILAPTE